MSGIESVLYVYISIVVGVPINKNRVFITLIGLGRHLFKPVLIQYLDFQRHMS